MTPSPLGQSRRRRGLSIGQPQCPGCGWHLHFCDGSLLGVFEWLAYCWNPSCRRAVVGLEDS